MPNTQRECGACPPSPAPAPHSAVPTPAGYVTMVRTEDGEERAGASKTSTKQRMPILLSRLRLWQPQHQLRSPAKHYAIDLALHQFQLCCCSLLTPPRARSGNDKRVGSVTREQTEANTPFGENCCRSTSHPFPHALFTDAPSRHPGPSI
jgi:hypothetical protein